jgi:hypothetical protein
LLVSNSANDSVVAFDEQTGRYLGAFIAPNSGGLLEPDTLSFGPDGKLYVSSGRQSTRRSFAMTRAAVHFSAVSRKVVA